jgi:hypothetical protein
VVLVFGPQKPSDHNLSGSPLNCIATNGRYTIGGTSPGMTLHAADAGLLDAACSNRVTLKQDDVCWGGGRVGGGGQSCVVCVCGGASYSVAFSQTKPRCSISNSKRHLKVCVGYKGLHTVAQHTTRSHPG